jgi:hypothetical protein
MAEATFACYAEAAGTAAGGVPQSALPSFAAARVRDALGYRPWHPPRQASAVRSAAAAPRNLEGRVARAAAGIRHRWPGRVLYRLAPPALVARLKRHLG